MIIFLLHRPFWVSFLLLGLKALDIATNILLHCIITSSNSNSLQRDAHSNGWEWPCSTYCMWLSNFRLSLDASRLCSIGKEPKASLWTAFPTGIFYHCWKPPIPPKIQDPVGQGLQRQHTHTIISYVDVFAMDWLVSPSPKIHILKFLISSTS